MRYVRYTKGVGGDPHCPHADVFFIFCVRWLVGRWSLHTLIACSVAGEVSCTGVAMVIQPILLRGTRPWKGSDVFVPTFLKWLPDTETLELTEDVFVVNTAPLSIYTYKGGCSFGFYLKKKTLFESLESNSVSSLNIMSNLCKTATMRQWSE